MLHKPPGLVVWDLDRSCLPWGGTLGPSRSRRDLFSVPGSTYGVSIQDWTAPGEQALVPGICPRQYTSWTTLLVVGIKLEEQTNPF